MSPDINGHASNALLRNFIKERYFFLRYERAFKSVTNISSYLSFLHQPTTFRNRRSK